MAHELSRVSWALGQRALVGCVLPGPVTISQYSGQEREGQLERKIRLWT